MIACTIAGSDSGGGAGIQADLKTFQELNVFGTSVITALTAQNTLGVHGVFPVDTAFVEAQLCAVLEDINIKAIKTGMLFDASIIQAVATILKKYQIPLVIDPVMIAKGGESLLLKEAVEALKENLLPLATVCTPNIPEAEVITGMKIRTEQDVYEAAQQILKLGVSCVVMKGGHLDGAMAKDSVFTLNEPPFHLETERINTKQTHGTGCTFSAALTAQLAKGQNLKDAIIEAKKFVHLAIQEPLNIGHGFGPTNHFAYRQFEGKCPVHVF
ncbi:MAG: bifunctional hydroxymethylpyrimidine kinase/phosphomethylpyrimidine kinase [Solibacillus sp.]|uniref:bifunctional hydroxymethylpyrimidine kinase/phosphomethylpyrimidine kinase n=1 Tax=unclassified Solibacillus TaxID=2637870 RepID=UPI0030FB538C